MCGNRYNVGRQTCGRNCASTYGPGIRQKSKRCRSCGGRRGTVCLNPLHELLLLFEITILTELFQGELVERPEPTGESIGGGEGSGTGSGTGSGRGGGTGRPRGSGRGGSGRGRRGAIANNPTPPVIAESSRTAEQRGHRQQHANDTHGGSTRVPSSPPPWSESSSSSQSARPPQRRRANPGASEPFYPVDVQPPNRMFGQMPRLSTPEAARLARESPGPLGRDGRPERSDDEYAFKTSSSEGSPYPRSQG